jgi:hypothetical protein
MYQGMNKLKYAALFVCLATALSGTFGCGGNGESGDVSDSSGGTSKTQTEQLSASEILEQLKTEISDENLDTSVYYSDETFKKNSKKLYAIEYTDLSDGGIIYNASGGVADEVSIIKPADGDTDYAVKALEARQQVRIQDYTGYKPEEISKIESANIYSEDGWAVFIISDNADDIADKLNKLL